MKYLRDVKALMTGASGGIGSYIAHALVDEGVHQVLTGRRITPLNALATSLRERGVRAAVIPADLSDPRERERLVKHAFKELSEIDILINNAAIVSGGAFTDLDPECIDLTVRTNFAVPIHLTRLVIPAMIRRNRGHVVNVSSVEGKRGVAFDAVYCGTKAALLEWSNGLRLELGGTGVHVSVVCPGFVTKAGMFARFGIAPPKTIGSCTPERVARATTDVVKRARPEVIVNSLPLRPVLGLAALSPRLAVRSLTALGVTRFQRRKICRARPSN